MPEMITVNHMIAINAHFDSKVIVPDEPVELPVDCALVVRIESAADATLPEPTATAAGPSALEWLAEHAVADALPSDLSYQHDHYLYGTPKKPQ